MAAGAWQIYNEFKLTLCEKVMDLSADSFKMALLLSTSNAGSVSLATAQYATLTNELTTLHGYTLGGAAITRTLSASGATITFTSTNPSWTASGGTLTARFAVIYDNTSTNKDLVCYCLLDSTPADVSVTSGNVLTVQINAAGIFTLA